MPRPWGGADRLVRSGARPTLPGVIDDRSPPRARHASPLPRMIPPQHGEESYESPVQKPAEHPALRFGLIFWFRWNKLSGSYLVLSATSRS